MVGGLGYALGMGMTAAFFAVTTQAAEAARGVVLLWQIMAGTAAVVAFIVVSAIFMSMRKVVRLEPAEVFRT